MINENNYNMALVILLAIVACMQQEISAVHLPKPTIFNHGIGLNVNRPLNIGHRGAAGLYPDNTVKSYQKAIDDGADVIECDVIITKDLKLVCRHESYLSPTTNVANIAQFQNKRKTYLYEGQNKTDWFSVDFTLDELLQIRTIQPISIRDQSFNNKFTIATFDEFIEVAKNASRKVGIYPEIKDPSFINSVPGLFPNGTRFEDIVIRELTRHGYTKKEDGCLLQAFEEESLVYIKDTIKTEIPLVMCLWIDVPDSVLDRWQNHSFYAVCCWKDQIYRNYKQGSYKHYIFETTNFFQKLKNRGFKVHVYTFRNEDKYLAWDYGQDIKNEYDNFFKLDADGYFTDFPATLDYYLDNMYSHMDDTTKETVNKENNNCISCASGMYLFPSSVLVFVLMIIYQGI